MTPRCPLTGEGGLSALRHPDVGEPVGGGVSRAAGDVRGDALRHHRVELVAPQRLKSWGTDGKDG